MRNMIIFPFPLWNLLLAYGKKIQIICDNKFYINRCLDNKKFLNLTNYKIPSWKKMLLEMKNFDKKYK